MQQYERIDEDYEAGCAMCMGGLDQSLVGYMAHSVSDLMDGTCR